MTLQNNLANFSFLSLLGSMVFYWVGTSFRGFTLSPVNTNPQNVVNVAFSDATTSSVASATSLANPLSKPDLFSQVAKYGILLSNFLLGSLLVLRWKESGHFPLSNLYESLMFLSWCFTLIHLLIENYTAPLYTQHNGNSANLGSVFLEGNTDRTKVTTEDNHLSNMKASPSNPTKNLVGAITTPSALLTNAFATFTLPQEMQEASPLVPALQSNWLMMHVTVMILSYAALIIGSLLSIAFLIVTFEGFDNNSNKINPTSTSLNTQSASNQKKSNIALMLDNLSYRILGIGFPFLTIGILSGAVWANEAWGSYWSWDPKETWALLTWLIFAIYLHTRLSKGWQGKKPAIIASFGFVIVWICYLGVNLIGEGLHSYGWITA